MQVCGYGARQSGGGVSSIPSVKAYFGTLPPDRHGIEFTTSVRPTSCNPTQGGNVSWSQGSAGVIPHPNDPDMVCITIDTIRLQY